MASHSQHSNQASQNQQQQQLLISSDSGLLPQDQRDFLKAYIEDQMLPANQNPSQEEIEEMESVLYSVSFGRQEIQKKATYQAFSAAISREDHVQLVLHYISRRERIRLSKNKILAYRVNQRETDNRPNDNMNADNLDEGTSQHQSDIIQNKNDDQNNLLTEGFDDAGEEGCGQKLLHLLQKMGVENILVIVCAWHNKMAGQFSTDTYRMVLERAKDLLTSLHVKVLEAEKNQQRIQQQQIVPYVQRDTKKRGSGKSSALQTVGLEVTTKVYPTNVIPDKSEASQNIQKKNFRPNNFMSDFSNIGLLKGRRGSMQNETEEDYEQLEIELTEDEFNYAVKMTEHSIRRLTKAHIIELRNQVKPHPLVEKVLIMVCILRGCVAPNWTVAREIMASMTFKMELMLMDVKSIKQSLIKRVIKILNQYQKQLTPDNLSLISEGATILLTWIINLVKWNAGSTKYKFDENALGGHKIMNHALVPKNSDGQDYPTADDDESANIYQTEEDNRGNTYGLMVAQPKGLEVTPQQEQMKQPGNRLSQKSKQKNYGAHINQSSAQASKPGSYLQSKQMVFGDSHSLQPNKLDLMQRSPYQHLQDNQTAQSLQNQLVKHYQEQQRPQLDEQQQIRNMIDMLEADKRNNWEELRQRIPEDEDEILKFLDSAVLEEQPTEVLVQLAQKLKERRNKLYQEQQNDNNSQF